MNDKLQRLLEDHNFMLSVTEVGVGIPLTNSIVLREGASEIFFSGHCPYSRESSLHHQIGYRSVSREAVSLLLKSMWAENSDKIRQLGKQPVMFAFSGSHSSDHSHETHGWMGIKDDLSEFLCHIRLPGGIERQKASEKILISMRNFIETTIINKDSIESIDDSVDVDVLDGVSIEDMLKFCCKRNPIYFEADGTTSRAMDAIRTSKPWFRGSFNPPTKLHEEILGSSVAELSMTNARKGTIDIEDTAHRVRMLNAAGFPVLVTCGCSKFVDLENMFRDSFNKRNSAFVLGSDTFNAVVSDGWCPTEDFLDPIKDCNIIVFEREGAPIDYDNVWRLPKAKLSLDIQPSDISSTDARNGNLSNLSEPVTNYILNRNLYDLFSRQ